MQREKNTVRMNTDEGLEIIKFKMTNDHRLKEFIGTVYVKEKTMID